MSAVTWLNSPRRSRQLIATVQNHIKIRDWHRYNPEVWCLFPFVVFSHQTSLKLAAPKPAPTVNWRKAQADSQSGPGKPKTNSQSSTSSEAQVYDHMDIGTGDVDSTPLVNDVDRTAFAVPQHINIQSPSLLDMLSDKPIVPAIAEKDKSTSVLVQSMAKPKDEDWEVWD
jgi:hypothetical protein